ncbi:hypothetical protein L9F63_013332, partial [Diploptera punctata]
KRIYMGKLSCSDLRGLILVSMLYFIGSQLATLRHIPQSSTMNPSKRMQKASHILAFYTRNSIRLYPYMKIAFSSVDENPLPGMWFFTTLIRTS